jgi:hypothetical protein
MGIRSKFTTPNGGYKEGSEHFRASKRVCNSELRLGVLTTSTSHSAELGFKSRNKYLLPWLSSDPPLPQYMPVLYPQTVSDRFLSHSVSLHYYLINLRFDIVLFELLWASSNKQQISKNSFTLFDHFTSHKCWYHAVTSRSLQCAGAPVLH